MLNQFGGMLVVVALFVAAGGAQAQSYKLNQVLESDRDVILQEIAVTSTQTVVSILLRNTTAENTEACAHPTGAAEAFSLKDLETGKVWKQESIKGLSSCAVKMDVIKPRASKLLTITFANLPATAKRLQLSENNCQDKPESDMEYWCFSEVMLGSKK